MVDAGLTNSTNVEVIFGVSGDKAVYASLDAIARKQRQLITQSELLNKRFAGIAGGLGAAINAQKQQAAATKGITSEISKLTNGQLKLVSSSKAVQVAEVGTSRAYVKSTRYTQKYTDILGRNFTVTGNVAGSMQKMTLWQKLSNSQWKTAFPRLNRINNAFNTLRWTMVNFTFALAAVGAVLSPFILLTKQGMEFELELRRIMAVSDDYMKSVSGMQAAASSLIELKAGQPFSIKDTATALLEFQKAGFTVKESMKAVPEIMDLSIAGFTDLETATKIVATTLHQFAGEGLTAKKVVDVIAKAANLSAIDVETFGNALSYVGSIAANMDIPFENLAAAIALLSNAGLSGSKSGTVLRQVLNKIANASNEAQQQMDTLGISFYDAQGNFVGLSKSMTILRAAFEGLTNQQIQQKISKLFNIRGRAGVAAFINFMKDGGSTIDEFSTLLDESGYAAKTAADIHESSAMKMKTAWTDLQTYILPAATAMNAALTKVMTHFQKYAKQLSVGAQRGRLTSELDPTITSGATLLGGAAAGYAGYKALGLLGTAYKGITATAANYITKIGAAGTVTKLFGKSALTSASQLGTFEGTLIGSAGAAEGATAATTGLTAAVGTLIGVVAGVTVVIGGLVFAWKKMRALSETQTDMFLKSGTAMKNYAALVDYYTSIGADDMAANVQRQLDALAKLDETMMKSTKNKNFWIQMSKAKLWIMESFATHFDTSAGVETTKKYFDKQRALLDKEMTDYNKEAEAKMAEIIKKSDIVEKHFERTAMKSTILKGINLVRGGNTFLSPDATKLLSTELNKEIQGVITTKVAGADVKYEYNTSLNTVMKRQAALKADIAKQDEATTDQLEEQNYLARVYNVIIEKIYNDLSKMYNLPKLKIIIDEASEAEATRSIIARNKKTLDTILDNFKMSFAPKASAFLDKFWGENKLFGEGSATEATARYNSNLKDSIEKDTDIFKKLTDKLYENEIAYNDLGVSIKHINALIDDQKAIIKDLNDDLSEYKSVISSLSSQRFEGETPFAKIIEAQDQVVKKQKLEEMGITNVQKFIQNVLAGTANAYDNVVAAIDNVSAASSTSQDQFEAWQKTVKEHIYDLVKSGEDLATNTTNAVKAHAALYLSVSKYSDRESKDRVNIEQTKLDALNAANEMYYSGMHKQIDLANQADEDRLNAQTLQAEAKKLLNSGEIKDIETKTALEAYAAGKVPENTNIVLVALKHEWKARYEIISQIDEQTRKLNELKTKSIENLDPLDKLEKKFKTLGDEIYTATQNLNAFIRGMSKYGGGSSSNMSSNMTSHDYFTVENANPQSVWHPKNTFRYNDFISRPGQEPVNFSSMDTIVGFKGELPSNNSITIGEINITGVNSDNPEELAYQLAQEIKKELRNI